MNERMNPFDQLLKWLDDGTLNHNLVQIAYRAHIRNSKVLPKAVSGLLGGEKESNQGLLGELFMLMNQINGNMELAYRRGYSAGLEDAKKGINNG